jgi:hypothetical protein
MRDIAVRPIVRTGAAFALTIAAVVVAVFALLHFGGIPSGGARLAGVSQLSSPGLAAAPQDELGKYRHEKRARLDSTGWVDRNAGIAHIPIADAMDLLAQRNAQGAKP